MFRIRLKPTLKLALLCTMAVIVLSTACVKLDPEVTEPRLAIEKPPFSDHVPTDYGRLVSAVPHFEGRWVSLWFERPDTSIVGVWVETRSGAIGKVIEIPRR